MPDFFNFMVEGGDELLHSHQCPHCKNWFHEDAVEWIDKDRKLGRCPSCLQEVKLKG